MPCSMPERPRHRLPPPITTATSTPSSLTAFTLEATTSACSGLMPRPSGPASASPPSLSNMRRYFAVGMLTPGSACFFSLFLSRPGAQKNRATVPCQPPGPILLRAFAQFPAGETADNHVLADGGDRLRQQIGHRQLLVFDEGL